MGYSTKKKVAETGDLLPCLWPHRIKALSEQIGGAWGGICPTENQTPHPGAGSSAPADFFGGSSDAKKLLPVLLDTRGAQAREAVPVDRVLPGEEFLDRQRIAAAGFFQRQKSATHGCDDFGLTPNHPALRPGRRQVGNRERATVRPDHVLDPRAMRFGHGYSHAL